MGIIMKLFGIPLGWIMHFLYNWIPNYGVALLIFTVLTRIIMIPITIKQQQYTAQTSALQPKIREIQEKYSYDRVRMQDEITNLYEEEGISQTSGCLPMLIQFPILFGLIDVIYKPLSHIVRLPNTTLSQAGSIWRMLGNYSNNANTIELDVISSVRKNPLFYGALGSGAIGEISRINYNFLGMNLMTRPEGSMFRNMFNGQFDPVIFIPIVAGLSALAMSLLSMKQQKASMGNVEGAGAMQGMMLFMPLMSVWIAFTVPAGVGLYWIYSNLFGAVQSYFMNKFYNPKDMKAKMEAERKERKEKERQERLEARRKLQAGLLGEEHADKAMTQKELDSLKLAAARKRDAEKYGDPLDEEDQAVLNPKK